MVELYTTSIKTVILKVPSEIFYKLSLLQESLYLVAINFAESSHNQCDDRLHR